MEKYTGEAQLRIEKSKQSAKGRVIATKMGVLLLEILQELKDYKIYVDIDVCCVKINNFPAMSLPSVIGGFKNEEIAK